MKRPGRFIRRIEVKKLFGVYDYVLELPHESSEPANLLILYGDNGSGKTNILKALFHMLAPEDGEGHRTAVAAIPFQRFEVKFADGAVVWAQRSETVMVGSFEMGVRAGRGKETTVGFVADEDNVVKASSPEEEENIRRFLAKLRQLELSLYFLADDRTVRLAGRERRDIPFAEPEWLEEDFIYSRHLPSGLSRMRRRAEIERRAHQLLIGSIKRAENWIQLQAMRGAAAGEESVNALYNQILERIAKSPLETKTDARKTIRNVRQKIDQIETRSRTYSRYGLIPEFNGKDILAVTESVPESHVGIVSNVIQSYLESVEKKLDAMAGLQQQVDSLVRIVNSFLTGKKLSFEIHGGFLVTTDDGKPLEVYKLSSGERHLLLLFCNALIAFGRPSIFIIDEPEISLNIKWQRHLLSSLLECAAGNPVQYVLATHSLELLARYRDNVIKLAVVG